MPVAGAALKERNCVGLAASDVLLPVPPGETMPTPFGPMALDWSVKAHEASWQRQVFLIGSCTRSSLA